MTSLQKRCIEISFRLGLTHLSSVLHTVGVIEDIYKQKQPHEPFVLGNSHAALALFVVLENLGGIDAQSMMMMHGTHAERNMKQGVWVSGGSLGQAETVALGFALANRHRRVWLVTSDGACMEGCVWEVFRIAENLNLGNLWATVICNEQGAYSRISLEEVGSATCYRAVRKYADTFGWPKWLCGLAGHYVKLNREQYEELMA